VGLGDAGLDLLGPEAADGPGDLLVVRKVDAEPALGGGGELVPVVVQGGVDVDGDFHERVPLRASCPQS
jgi:hypothetical protein